MSSKSYQRTNAHHGRSSVKCGLRYLPQKCHSSDFPVSDLWEVTVEPKSHPVTNMHWHDALEIGYCHSGSGVLLVEEAVIPFVAGDISLITDRDVHMSRGASGRSARWSYFWMDPGLLLAGMPDALETINLSVFGHKKFPKVLSSRKHKQLCQTVSGIVEEMESRRPGYRIVVKGLAYVLLTLLQRLSVGLNLEDEEISDRRTGVERIAPALNYMLENYADPVDVKNLASRCQLSEPHFRRLFLAAVGKPPLQYVGQLRARMAAAILAETDRPVSVVAYEVGFESINTFNRQFMATLNVTPSQWRTRSSKTTPAKDA